MNRAIFITGFNNWGKTTIIQNLFSGQRRYSYGYPYSIPGINAKFTVETHSNDDYFGINWVNQIETRMNAAHPSAQHLFTALCPSMEPNNNFVNLLMTPTFNRFSSLYLFLIEYKWEHHAKLIIDNISIEASKIPNLRIIRINAEIHEANHEFGLEANLNQIRTALDTIFNT